MKATVSTSLLLILLSCGKNECIDIKGNFETAMDGTTAIYRAKWDGHSVAILNEVGCDFATCLLILRFSQNAVEYIERVSGEKLPDPILVKLIKPESNPYNYGGCSINGAAQVLLKMTPGIKSPITIFHEFTHLLPASKVSLFGFFNESRARYISYLYADEYIFRNTNSFEFICSVSVFSNIVPLSLKNVQGSERGLFDISVLLVKLSMKERFYLPLAEMLTNFNKNYHDQIFTLKMSKSYNWGVIFYSTYALAFSYYLIEKYGLDVCQEMMNKEFEYPIPDNFQILLLEEFYKKSLSELETGFTNYISHYLYQNRYLHDTNIISEIESFFMNIKNSPESLKTE
ncbi:MAG: hypothetical protein A2Y33_12120 [Spirochaetes bacterium GWF1_51_8]|nr:MAG: hypothetical protein A2Y33_12120 [Spirochaetes bacterium GWF1_51_8]